MEAKEPTYHAFINGRPTEAFKASLYAAFQMGCAQADKPIEEQVEAYDNTLTLCYGMFQTERDNPGTPWDKLYATIFTKADASTGTITPY